MTGYGFTGPMTARGTIFNDKALDVGGDSRGRMLTLGIGCFLLLLLA